MFEFHFQFELQSSQELEADFVLLRNATDEKIRISEEQLQEARDYQDRTAVLIERTSQQLLLEESKTTSLMAMSKYVLLSGHPK